MTWKEFKEKVDKELIELGIDENTDICWIDVVLYGSDEVEVEYVKKDECLKIEN